MKFIHYENERVLGIYDPDIHAAIPEPSFPVSDEVWQAFLSDQSAYKVAAGTLVYAPVIPESPTPEELMTGELTALDAEYAPQRKELWEYLGLAVNYWQDQEAADSIRVEIDALEGEYNQRAEAIWNEYNQPDDGAGGDETLP